MLQKIKSAYRAIKDGEPGSRFSDHFERSRGEGRRSFWKSFGYISVGVVLLLAGFVLSLPPGVPGFLLWIPGLSMIATRSKRFSKLLDRLELWARKAWKRLAKRG